MGVEPWLVEGTAEYFAAAHLSKGRFDFTEIESHIREHVRKLTPPKAQQVTTLSVSKLLRMSSRDWHTRTENLPPGEALQSYTSSLLLTHYAFHGGAERRKEVRSYLEALDKVSFVRKEKPRLFSPADAMEIESKIKTYWKLKGPSARLPMILLILLHGTIVEVVFFAEKMIVQKGRDRRLH